MKGGRIMKIERVNVDIMIKGKRDLAYIVWLR